MSKGFLTCFIKLRVCGWKAETRPMLAVDMMWGLLERSSVVPSALLSSGSFHVPPVTFFLRSKVFTTGRDEIVMGRQFVSVAHLTSLRTFQHIRCYPRLLEAQVLRTATGCQSQPLNSSRWSKAWHRKWKQREVSLGSVRGMEERALMKWEAKWGRRDVGKAQEGEEPLLVPLVWPENSSIPVYPSVLPTHGGDAIFGRELFSLPNTLGFPFPFLLILFTFFPPLCWPMFSSCLYGSDWTLLGTLWI